MTNVDLIIALDNEIKKEGNGEGIRNFAILWRLRLTID